MNDSSHLGTLLRVVMFAFVVTLVGIGLMERGREREEHRSLRTAFDAQKVESEDLAKELSVTRGALRFQARAFQDLVASHEELQALHRVSMDWGPLRAPRDCVREIILIDESAWPNDRDGELAYYIKAYEWSELARVRVVEDLDQCFQFSFPRERPELPDPRAGDADSSWIDWPEGHVVEHFPSHEKAGGNADD